MCPPEAFTSSASTESLDPASFVPSSETSKAAFQHASSLLHPAILNHSIRVYLYARALAAASNSAYHTNPAKQDLLFLGCIFHDIGTTDTYNGPQRFEVEGADAAVAHLGKYGVSEADKQEVWNAIALHTSPGIVERMGELCVLVRRGVETDFGRRTEFEGIDDLPGLKAHFEGKYARLNIEKILSDKVVEQAIKQPGKAPSASWPGILYKSYLQNPDWTGVNKAF